MTSESVPLVVVVGPTASGKSALALALAERFGGEIVNADSRQIYRLMEIGTAKPGAAERARVPHHLLDRVWPEEPLTLAQYQSAATATIADVRARGRRAPCRPPAAAAGAARGAGGRGARARPGGAACPAGGARPGWRGDDRRRQHTTADPRAGGLPGDGPPVLGAARCASHAV